MISLIAHAALAAAAPAGAIAADPADESTIVVMGERKPAKETIRAFVRDLTPVAWQRQLGRFEQPVCPATFGLPPRQADGVTQRIRRVAQAAAIRVGGSQCAPNLVVIVTADKTALLEQLRRDRPEYFGILAARQTRALVRDPGPAAAWHLAGPPVNARGVELQVDPAFETYVNRTTEPVSRIHSAARPSFDGAVVVVRRSALAGLTVAQLADYAALRALTGADPARLAKSPVPSILTVLEAPMGSAVPITMTKWDLGFLRGFYASPRNLGTGAQRSEIAKGVARELKGEQPR
ncbi:MAG TPA: hypothetical protein VFS45_06355 [Sphingomicrobium sp.]|nr:hypothetical protein [Sphingomicrobium sp.]